MKSFLTTLICILLSFFGTLIVLKKINGEALSFSLPSSTSNEVVDLKEVREEVPETVSDEVATIAEDSSDQDYSEITVDTDTWTEYYETNIDLNTDFIAVDIDGNETTKKEFLERLITGRYIPVKLESGVETYQLYKVGPDVTKSITNAVKKEADIIYHFYIRENAPFPEFNFEDLSGNEYTSANTSGKFMVLLCWFTQSQTCISEFGKLNDLYDKFEDQEHVVFLGLAFDDSKKLKRFLSEKEFRYHVVPSQKQFLKNELQIKQYPTHIIVDEYGIIKHMFNNVDDLSNALNEIINGDLIEDMM